KELVRMQKIGTLTAFCMAETGLAIMMWTAAFATRGWVTGYLITQDISAGLFTAESNGIVHDIDTS
ncbi:hypothetical protein BgiMline_032107, partial [Biomphalaria glabrata]